MSGFLKPTRPARCYGRTSAAMLNSLLHCRAGYAEILYCNYFCFLMLWFRLHSFRMETIGWQHYDVRSPFEQSKHVLITHWSRREIKKEWKSHWNLCQRKSLWRSSALCIVEYVALQCSLGMASLNNLRCVLPSKYSVWMSITQPESLLSICLSMLSLL